MLKYILRRVLLFIPTLLAVSMVTFMLIQLPPGDYLTTIIYQLEESGEEVDEALLEGYRWRNLGPDRGGRSIAVSGVVGQPDVAYFGAVGGGLWKERQVEIDIAVGDCGHFAFSDDEPLHRHDLREEVTLRDGSTKLLEGRFFTSSPQVEMVKEEPK